MTWKGTFRLNVTAQLNEGWLVLSVFTVHPSLPWLFYSVGNTVYHFDLIKTRMHGKWRYRKIARHGSTCWIKSVKSPKDFQITVFPVN